METNILDGIVYDVYMLSQWIEVIYIAECELLCWILNFHENFNENDN